MFVKDWMSREVMTLARDASLFDAKGLMRACKIRHVPVVESDRVIGLLSQTDVLHASAMIGESIDSSAFHQQLKSERVDSHMTASVISVSTETPIEDAAALMRDRKIGCVVVLDEGDKLAGILTQTDMFNILVSSLGAGAGSARKVFDLDPADEQGALARIGAWLNEGQRKLRYLATYNAGDDQHPQVVVRAEQPGD